MKLLQKNHFKYGLIMSGVLIICLLVLHLLGQQTNFDEGILLDTIFALAPFVIWFFSLKAYKKELNNNMSFKQGVIHGVKISVVFGVVSSVIFMSYYLLFNPGILNYIATSYGMKNSPTGLVISVDMTVQLLGSIIMGTLYTAILSFFLKSKPTQK
jgi:cyanate permease